MNSTSLYKLISKLLIHDSSTHSRKMTHHELTSKVLEFLNRKLEFKFLPCLWNLRKIAFPKNTHTRKIDPAFIIQNYLKESYTFHKPS